MKTVHVLLLSLLFPAFAHAQNTVTPVAPTAPTAGDSALVKPASKAAGDSALIKLESKAAADSALAQPGSKAANDTASIQPTSKGAADTAATHKRIEIHTEAGLTTRWRYAIDSIFYTKYNKYGDLKDDDPAYNPRRPWWLIGLKVTGANLFVQSVDKYVLKYDFCNVGFRSWKYNLKTGWEWDVDRFGMNFFFHPYSGAGYFVAARSSGWNYYESIPFAFAGSLMWEYFGETTLPAKNDIINTPVSGIFIGEILYRLSSNILDDRATGSNRWFRELAATLVSPTRAFSRLTTGALFRHTTKEIYQKEPLNITLFAGVRKVNDGARFGTGRMNGTFDVLLDYGNPFEKRSRKPFDYFKVRASLNLGAGRKILDNITGLGILAGKNVQVGPLEALLGVFHHYDYWDNKTFELGTMTFGGGIASKMPLFSGTHMYTAAHVGVVPFAGNSTRYGPDTSQFRDYNYGGGLGAKVENTFEFGKVASATFIGYYYWIRTYVGHKGDHYMAILRPRLEVRFSRNFSAGFEHFMYYSDRYPADFHAIHIVRTEQRVFLKLYLEQFKRKE